MHICDNLSHYSKNYFCDIISYNLILLSVVIVVTLLALFTIVKLYFSIVQFSFVTIFHIIQY